MALHAYAQSAFSDISHRLDGIISFLRFLETQGYRKKCNKRIEF
jgi:hypothetical protein